MVELTGMTDGIFNPETRKIDGFRRTMMMNRQKVTKTDHLFLVGRM
jgi:hypothetical protein